MCRKFICMAYFMLVTGLLLTSVARAELVGWWRLDEGSGNVAFDSSGYGRDGTLNGDPQWVAGYLGGALEFDGDDHVDTGYSENLANWTIAAWVKSPAAPSSDSPSGPVHRENNYQFNWNHSDATFRGAAALNVGGTWYAAKYEPLEADIWYHLAATYDGENLVAYRDGEMITNNSSPSGNPNSDSNTLKLARHAAATQFFTGIVDDARVYNEALSAEDIQVIMFGTGIPKAISPDPPDGAIHTDTWVTMSWRPGDFAVSHDVYMGENFDDVNEGTGDTFRGNTTMAYFVAGFPGYPYPDGLVPGTTYYWRIDEVNDADPNSPWKGDVWSFFIPPKTAYNPNPVNGAEFIDLDVTLNWTAGYSAKLHVVYFGDDFDTVSDATGGPMQGIIGYDPGPLEPDKTYYWRVDQLDGTTTHKGDVWSFTTLPDIPINDPNLMGWWKLDEGSGTTAVDWSGHGNHGTFQGDPQWVAGYDGGAVEFDGESYIDTGYTENLATWTIACWVISPEAPSGDAASGPLHREQNYQFNWNHADVTYRGAAAMSVGGTWYAASYMPLNANQWYHLAATYDGNELKAYRDGVLITTNSAPSGAPAAESNSMKLGRHAAAVQFFTGTVDDARVYDRALTTEEIQKIMRGDPYVAWNPVPANGSTPNVKEAIPISWSPGDNAAQHDVYFGTDKDAIDDADTTTADVYRGRQAATSYSPTEGVEWGGGPYYWRIDEVRSDGAITKGRIWNFTVADFILIDDFESYNAVDNEIWYAWHDGLGAGAIGTPDYLPGNGTGSAVGDESTPSFTEETIVHGGRQSMPLAYDNNKQGFAKYSEAEKTLTNARDWTEQGVENLSLWFRGYPASVGSFVEGPVGTFTMTGSGADIWAVNGVEADEFHFAYKMLNGAGTIVARVQSVDNTNGWAKAGVMIRESLNPDSAHAFACVTPANGVAFQYRPSTGGTSANYNQTGVAAPYWVKLERSISGLFTVSHSANGTSWQPVTGAAAEPIPMGTNVYIGFAVTAHDATLTCQAVFSNVTITGNVTGQWAHQDIGILSNDAEPLYVAVSNGAGDPAIVVHDDPAAATIDTWTEWVIPLSAFADQGIVLTDVTSIAIGLGTRGNMTIPGGSGKIFIDDIRLYRAPEPEPEPEPQP